MTVKNIITRWLYEHGYDGLFNEETECACLMDDLMPCCFDNTPLECQPGYRTDCSLDCENGPCTFHVVAIKPEVTR